MKIKNKRLKILLFIIFVLLIITSYFYIEEKNNKLVEQLMYKKELTPDEERLNSWGKIKYQKLKSLNFANEYLSYFNIRYLDRYVAYKEKNPNYELEKIILYVNIGLDSPFYTNTTIVKEPHKLDVLVNKYHLLPNNFEPDGLETINPKYQLGGQRLKKEARIAFEELAEAALNSGFVVKAASTYRSFNYQKNLYNSYVRQHGMAQADTFSARPRSSEHELGLAVDVSDNRNNILTFESSPSYKWMLDNAHNYGFILRYPKGKETITGYNFESWHYRYVNKDIATKMYNDKISTYEEFYELNKKNNS